jgi:signal transduction histidine kinase
MMLFSQRGKLLYLLVWLLLALILAGVLVVGTGCGVPNALLFVLPLVLLYAYASGFSAYYLCRAWPLSQHPGSSILTALGLAALLSALLWSALAHEWNRLAHEVGLDWFGIHLTSVMQGIWFGLGLVLYALVLGVHYLMVEVERSREAAARELQAHLAAQQAELRMLRTQIDPHFLFNSLNSISALTSIDAARARAMTLQLADFFRLSLHMEAHKKVPLTQELALIRHFLAVEQVRFGERLQVQEQIDAEAGQGLILPMLIQPLVENAVKHGIAHLPQGGCITICAMRVGETLQIRLENPVDPDLPLPATNRAGRTSGIGLANVRQRLQLAYEQRAGLDWQREPGRFMLQITLPYTVLEPSDAHPDR